MLGISNFHMNTFTRAGCFTLMKAFTWVEHRVLVNVFIWRLGIPSMSTHITHMSTHDF
jgi:hypothetical protein